jgi:hypothetical protein
MFRIPKSLSAILLGLAVTVGGFSVAPAAQADASFPYGDRATDHIADELKGTRRVGWLATTLDYGCAATYTGPRHAEIVRIPAGHGRRWVGIIHVSTTARALEVRATLECQGVWFAQRGGRFVLPLQSSIYTDGCSGDTFKQTARWAKKRLGTRWVVR